MLKYKIYINESPLWLLPLDVSEEDVKLPQSLLHAEYRGRPKMLFNYIDLLEKSIKHDGVIVQYHDVKKLYKDLKSLYTYIKAAGGVVRRDDGKILLIHRMGYWDLPKGKRDPGETMKKTALREVEEEVGFHHLVLEGKIGKTYHSFRTNSKRVMKKVNWYAMYTSNPKEIVLQYAESIDDAAWIDPKSFSRLKLKTYRSVEDILKKYVKKYRYKGPKQKK
jgi:8-oxo-dGTP pyrophosphatase MutT (NUDIX family)